MNRQLISFQGFQNPAARPDVRSESSKLADRIAALRAASRAATSAESRVDACGRIEYREVR